MLSNESFLKFVSTGKTLSTEDEKEVFNYYREHRTKENRNKIALKNAGLIRTVVKKYYSTDSGFGYDDLFQEGFIGLLKAVEDFDPSYGNRFSTYAWFWIRSGVSKYAANNSSLIHCPEKVRRMKRYAEEYTTEYEIENGVAPTNIEIANFLYLPVWEVEFLQRLTERTDVVSVEDALFDVNSIEDPECNVEETAIEAVFFDQLMKIMEETLIPKELSVLRKRYGFANSKEMTLEQIGKEMRVSRSRVKQIEDKAIIKMRRYYEQVEYC